MSIKLFMIAAALLTLSACSGHGELKSPCAGIAESPCVTSTINRASV